MNIKAFMQYQAKDENGNLLWVVEEVNIIDFVDNFNKAVIARKAGIYNSPIPTSEGRTITVQKAILEVVPLEELNIVGDVVPRGVLAQERESNRVY